MSAACSLVAGATLLVVGTCASACRDRREGGEGSPARPAPVPDAGGGPAPSTGSASVCASAADCPGGACELEPGCGSARGRCGPIARECTVSRPYCGCDGKTFFTCPPPHRPFSHKGTCEGGPPKKSGEPCARIDECEDVCLFEPGCDPPRGRCGSGAQCEAAEPICGCNGQTQWACRPFRAPLAHLGQCGRKGP